jgi:hypothetical protein
MKNFRQDNQCRIENFPKKSKSENLPTQQITSAQEPIKFLEQYGISLQLIKIKIFISR